MFRNLRAEMARAGLSGIQIAAKIEICEKAFSQKLNGKSEFTRMEMMRIKRLLPKGLTLEYLFDMNDENLRSA